MRSKVKLCSIEGCNSPSWSKGLCKSHGPKKPLTKIRLGTGSYKQAQIRDTFNNLCDLYKLIWNKRAHNSEHSGKYLGNEALTLFFHHILPKSKYPEAMFDEENIILLTPDEHATVEMNSTKYEEVNKRREQLKIKYNLN
jgi:hypothetical protein